MENRQPTSVDDALGALRQIVRMPIETWQDPEVMRGRLADRQVPASEVNLLVNALHEGVPQRILRESLDTPREVLMGLLRARLTEAQGMSTERASWAARTWLDALRPRASDIADDFVWGPDRRSGAGGIADAVVPAPPRKPFPVIAVSAGVLLLGLAGLAGWFATRNATGVTVEYSVIAVDVFTSEVEGLPVQGQPDFVASCMAGATFGSERCRAATAIPPQTPFVGVNQMVIYTTVPFESPTIAVTCALVDPSGRAAGTEEMRGEFPDPGFGQPTRASTTWRVLFARPESGWHPGRYKVTCESPRITIDGWFEVAG